MIDPSTLPSKPARFICVGDLVQAAVFSGEEDATVIGASYRLESDVISGNSVERVGNDIELFVSVVVVEADSEEDDFHGSGDDENVLHVAKDLFHGLDQRTRNNRL